MLGGAGWWRSCESSFARTFSDDLSAPPSSVPWAELPVPLSALVGAVGLKGSGSGSIRIRLGGCDVSSAPSSGGMPSTFEAFCPVLLKAQQATGLADLCPLGDVKSYEAEHASYSLHSL